MEKNKNDRVPLKGTISRETAEAWRRGDLKSNNGLRQSKGRASLSSEQPDVWIDEKPTIGQQLLEGLKQDLALSARREANRILIVEILPRVRDLVWNKLVPAAEKKLHKLKYGETKAAVLIREKDTQESTAPEDAVKAAGKIINIADLQSRQHIIGKYKSS